jgi:two-component system cell cycle sensor histidine kinase/response regulator CckA
MNGTVMVVDDEPMIRRLVARALTVSGCNVVDAESPVHAIGMMDSHPELDLLVTDVMMPEIGGRELAERMRKQMPGLKVLFISGFAPGDVMTDPAQGTDFLQKPFRVKELTERVGRMLAPVV